MIGSIAFVLLGAAVAATPCENLATLKLSDATITSAVVVPEGPPPRAAVEVAEAGGGRGGGARGGAAPRLRRHRSAAGGAPGRTRPQAAPSGGGGAPPAPPQTSRLIAAFCWISSLLPTPLSRWSSGYPTQNWNGKFMGVGNGGFAGSIQGRTGDMPQALRLGYATAGTDTGHQDTGRSVGDRPPRKTDRLRVPRNA